MKYMESQNELSLKDSRSSIILQFLGKIDSSIPHLIALYQCRIIMEKKEEREHVYNELKKAFEIAGRIRLVGGDIQEIMISIA